MYAFTAIDPDFKPKGSRDPLGFQPIWAETGRKLIKDLSTVSANINDFKILCFVRYFFVYYKKQKDEKDFLPFFLRMEQVFAYARRRHNHETAFNGSNFVSKLFTNDSYSISNDQKDNILSNQRTYGIYGKYIRPARDMGLFEHAEFANTFKKGFNTDVLAIFEKVYSEKKTTLTAIEIEPLAEMIKTISNEERIFFRELILQGSNPLHIQQKLYRFLVQNPEFTNQSKFNLFDYLNGLLSTSMDKELNDVVEEIIKTELVIAPLAYRFAYLLSEGQWTDKSIEKNEILNQKLREVEYPFCSDVVLELRNILPLTGVSLVESLIERNTKVSKRRNGSPWIIAEHKKYVVYFGEANRDFKLLEDNHWENSYFIQTYLRLFNAIEGEG